MKIIGIYKITNTITGDFYIGSSKNVKQRWTCHKCKSKWKRYPNNPMYIDMRKYGVENFVFEVLEVLEVVEENKLKEIEQQFIELLKPTYNNRRADGCDIERRKKAKKEYRKTDKSKKYKKEYNSQLCSYNDEVLTLCALSKRFYRAGIDHPTQEAKKYLLNKDK